MSNAFLHGSLTSEHQRNPSSPNTCGAPSPQPLTDVDVQVLLSNTQAVLLALRSNVKSSGSRYFLSSSSSHTLLSSVLGLQQELTQVASQGCAVPVRPSRRMQAVVPSSPLAQTTTSVHSDATTSITEWLQASVTAELSLSEAKILTPFCAICLQPETGETAITVALSSLSTMVEARCTFLTVKGLQTIIHASLASKGDLTADADTREQFLGRVASTCVACLQHPLAEALPEDMYVDVARAIVSMSVDPLPSLLLKRATETSLKVIVSLFYQRLSCQRAGEFMGTEVGRPTASKGLGDGSYMMRFISSLICGEVSLKPSEMVKSTTRGAPPMEDEGYDSVSLIQLEGLWLAQQALLTLSGRLREPLFRPLLHAVQENLCRALLVSGVKTKQALVLSLIVRTIHLVIHAAAECLVPQIYSFLRVLHLVPLSSAAEPMMGSANTSSPVLSPTVVRSLTEVNERREVLLDSLAYLCAQGPFCRFCYTNYDLSASYSAVLPQLCDVLLHQAYKRLESKEVNGNASKSPVTESHLMAIQAAGNLVLTLTEVYRARAVAGPSVSMVSRTVSSTASYGLIDKDVESAVQWTIKQKNLLVQLSTLFAQSPAKKGIPFLFESAVRVQRGEEREYAVKNNCWLVLAEPAGGLEIGQCLFRLNSLLDKRVLGEYLGEQGDFRTIRPDEGVMVGMPDGTEISAVDLWEMKREEESKKFGTASFYDAQLRGFIYQFNFKGKSLLHSIREMAYCVCLPGEAQKIDRIMEMFAKYWYDVNPPSADSHINPLCSDSCAFVLSFAIIMLNTDLHSGKVHQSMTFQDFRRINENSEDAGDIPEEYLREVYRDVKEHEIIMAEMMEKGFTNDITWSLEMGDSMQERTTESMGVAHKTTSTPPRLCFWDVLERSKEDASSMTLEALGTSWRSVVSLDSRTQQLLSRYVFASVWKRTMLLFSGVVRHLSQQLSCIPVLEQTIADCISRVNGVAPMELAALTSGLRGFIALITTAKTLNVPEVVDHGYGCLLDIIEPKEQTSLMELSSLSKDLPRMLCVREAFALLPQVSICLSDSWRRVGRILVNLFEMGALALTAEEEGSHSAQESSILCLPEALRRHPLVRFNDDMKRVTPLTSPESSGGWLSNLWSSALNTKKTRDNQDTQDVIQRVRVCVPNIRCFLDNCATIPPAPHQKLVLSICQASTAQFKSPADVRTFSYVYSLMCAMISEHGRKYPDALRTLLVVSERPLPVLFQMMDKKLPMDDANLRTAIEMSEPGSKTPLDSPVLWLRVLRRVVEGVMDVVMQGVVSPTPDMDLVLLLFKLLSGAPKRVYHFVVAKKLLISVEKYMSGITEQMSALAAPERRFWYNPTIALLQNSSQMLVRDTDFSLLQRYVALLNCIAEKEFYDPAKQTEELLEAAMSIGLMMEKVRRTPSRADLPELQPGRSASVVLRHCSRTILRCFVECPAPPSVSNTPCEGSAFLSGPSFSSPSSASASLSDGAPHLAQRWVLCMKAVGALAMRRTNRSTEAASDPEDPMTCLEECVLQAAQATRTSTYSLIPAIYKDVLCPLAETLCGPDEHNTTEGSGPHSCDGGTLSNAEVVIDRAFYNYWAEDLHPSVGITCRLLELLPQPLLRFPVLPEMSSMPPADTEAVVDWHFDVWKQLLAVLIRYQQLSSPATEAKRSSQENVLVQRSVKATVTEMVRVTCGSAANARGNHESPTDIGSALSTRADFFAITREMVSQFPFGVALLKETAAEEGNNSDV